jgi:hypothetical protein
MLIRILRPEGCEIEARKSFRQHQRVIIEIRLSTGDPTREFRPLLERDIALAKKGRLRDAHLFQGGAHCRPGTLAYADDADGLAFNQCYLQTAAGVGGVAGRDNACREPSGRAATDNANRSNRPYHALFFTPGNSLPSSKAGANADLPPASAIFCGEELVLVVSVLQKILVGQIFAFYEKPEVFIEVIGGAHVQLVA